MTPIIIHPATPSLTNFRITRSFDADLAEAGPVPTAADERILHWYDVLADAIAEGRTEDARELAERFV